MTENYFKIGSYDTKVLDDGQFTWKSPSNIALIKYWGKSEPQIPKNASISFTLKNCHTITTLEYKRKKIPSRKFRLKVLFDGKEEKGFEPKIEQFFERIVEYVPFISDYDFTIKTENSFPHSSGIASSASGMSALALCLMSMEEILFPSISKEHFTIKASFLSRLGSGSAARSVEGPIVVWGHHPAIENSSDLYGTKLPFKVHPVFENFRDVVLLVDHDKKSISSTVGHKLMHDHPFAESRFKQANNNLEKIIPILKEGNLKRFIEIVESEALTLHAMMMSSNPYFVLMKPNTLKIIDKIWLFRKNTNADLCFTLDAGANVHLLFPEEQSQVIESFISKELSKLCENNRYIMDSLGNGAERLS